LRADCLLEPVTRIKILEQEDRPWGVMVRRGPLLGITWVAKKVVVWDWRRGVLGKMEAIWQSSPMPRIQISKAFEGECCDQEDCIWEADSVGVVRIGQGSLEESGIFNFWSRCILALPKLLSGWLMGTKRSSLVDQRILERD